MKFKNTRATRSNMSMSFSNVNGSTNTNYLSLQSVTRPPVSSVVSAVADKRQLWGKHIWLFIHGLLEKLKDTSFHIVKEGLIYHLKSICGNLPCPDCSNHANQYLNKMDMNKIQSKRDLVLYFFTFHNDVNKRKGYPLYPVEQLEIYKKSNIKNMYQNFQYFFTEQYHSVKLISENFHRQRVARNVEDWLKQNACHFEV